MNACHLPSVDNVEPYHPSSTSTSKTPTMMSVPARLYRITGGNASFLTFTLSVLLISYNSGPKNITVKGTVQCTKLSKYYRNNISPP
ncbi:MAG TPA: hypothetical protein VIA09_03005 [Nitrososphaeraceae archaeon]